ncbi:MAG: phosphoenolpyruvate--protein phosphotransferase [Gammaproteobacteria bacterium]
MTLILSGTGVSSGIAIGEVVLLQTDKFDISEITLADNEINNEILRYREAISVAKANLKNIREQISTSTPDDIAAFIDAHLLMLYDATLAIAPIEIIKSNKCNAEWALKLQRDNLISVFMEMKDPYLRSRSEDIEHVSNSILSILLQDTTTISSITTNQTSYKNKILIATDLTPADTVLIQQQGFTGFVIEAGGPTSHTAILARSLKIPAIVGMSNALQLIKNNELIVIDGATGILMSGENRLTIQYYKNKKADYKKHVQQLLETQKKPGITLDGKKIIVRANIELPNDIQDVNKSGADGVGLYRTEFLFMNRDDNPTEQEQYEIYTKIAKQIKDQPLTIRTLDLGADKQVDGAQKNLPTTTNPALGLRAIRLCIKEPQLFIPQIRAILRASADYKLRIMIPMLSNSHELDQVLNIINDVKNSLKSQNIKYDKNIMIGAMIEVPAAALSADIFAQKMDFLSIGTNDLIQYTLAVDRIDESVNYLYDPLNPAVLQLIKMTIDAGKKNNIPVSMCGEMAGDICYTCLLLGMGLTEFSMHPSTIPEIKYKIQKCNLKNIKKQVSKLLNYTSIHKFHDMLDKLDKLS